MPGPQPPLYQQIVDALEAKITKGDKGYRPGDRIPSTEVIGANFKTSGQTASKAITILRRRGLLIAAPKGFEVRGRIKDLVQYATPALSDTWPYDAHAARRQGSSDNPSIHLPGAHELPGIVQEIFDVAGHAGRVVERRHINRLDGEPKQLIRQYLPAGIARTDDSPFVQPETIDIEAALRGEGIRPARHLEAVTTRVATVTETAFLQIKINSWIVQITRITYDKHDRPVMATVTIYEAGAMTRTYELPVPPDAT